jgi:hypothetical protein
VITQGVPPYKRLDEMHSWHTEATFTDTFNSKSSDGSKRAKMMTASVNLSDSAKFIFVATPHPARNPWPYKNGRLPECVRKAVALAIELHQGRSQ